MLLADYRYHASLPGTVSYVYGITVVLYVVCSMLYVLYVKHLSYLAMIQYISYSTVQNRSAIIPVLYDSTIALDRSAMIRAIIHNYSTTTTLTTVQLQHYNNSMMHL